MSETEPIVKIRVNIKKGSVLLIDGKSLESVLVADAQADLLIGINSITDKTLIDWAMNERVVDILPAESQLLFVLSSRALPENIQYKLSAEEKKGSLLGKSFVAARLKAPLNLRIRGARGSLDDVSCYVEAIKETVPSINQAYTRLSEVYEPWRKSHTGNAFNLVYYFDTTVLAWYPLSTLRDKWVDAI